MNFKSFLPIAVIAGVAAVEMVAISPVQAGVLAPGAFQLSSGIGGVSIKDLAGDKSSFTLEFNSALFDIDAGQAKPTGAFAGLTENNLIINSLLLNKVGVVANTSVFTLNNTTGSEGYFNFISGLSLPDGRNIFVDILAGNNFSVPSIASLSTNNFTVFGELRGRVRDADDNVISAGFVSALNFKGSGTNSIGVATVPTPALLPGLLGMAAGILRKRSSNDNDIEESQA